MAKRKNPRKVRPGVAARLADADWLSARYVDGQMSTNTIASLLGVSARTVTIWLENASIPRRTRGTHAGRDPGVTDRLATDVEHLRRRYVDEGRSIRWIAGELHANHHDVANALRAHGIPIRANPVRGTTPDTGERNHQPERAAIYIRLLDNSPPRPADSRPPE